MTSDPPNEVRLQEVAQIAFTVQNLAEAKAFYRDVLELKFLFDAGTMAFFQCGPVRLMIGESDKPSASEGTIVYFRVADLEATARLLESRGANFVQPPHLVARMKSYDLWMAFLKDPAGNTLGLMSEIARSEQKVA
ncbi:MAG: VOC family protein [Acidobacteriaceae bacterium]|jgi:methylmalonyl-CoA/ethylmalonyl-CoA epimerase